MDLCLFLMSWKTIARLVGKI